MRFNFRYIILPLLFILATACAEKEPEPEQPTICPVELFVAKGADISWVTEMEKNGYKFRNTEGKEMECTELMCSLGFNSVRLRVWVNPSDGWCGKEDVLVKAKRAQALGMKIMIDFHYSDSWADPGKQNIPAAWKSYGLEKMTAAVADHTKEVLRLLKDNGVDVEWVQVGNETDTGMLWQIGSVTNANKGTDFVKLLNSGYEAVKSVYPSAIVLVHHSSAQDLSANQWFFDILKNAGARYDMIGLSLYPSYWSNGGYPDWKNATYQAVSNFVTLHDRYSKPVMLVEFGMPASQPEKCAEALKYIMDSTKDKYWFTGVFYWEPESEHSRNGYDYGAFADGRPTAGLAPFKN